MDQLLLGVVLFAAALPVAVGLIHGLGLLLALVFIQVLAQVQDAAAVFLEKRGRQQTARTTGMSQYVKEAFWCSFAYFLSYLFLHTNESSLDLSVSQQPLVID